MGRLRTLSRITDGATAVWNLAAAARSERGLVSSYFLIGLCAGFLYRGLQRRYVGRIRDHPGRYALLTVSWWPIGAALVWTADDEATLQSFAAGLSLGSLLYAGTH
ncbi:hypothetical protein C483_04579 [Natrialba hulunbeirensis JCM 10989]|uniref:Uncharacterized protein n=1 Tax=Natrialba hulunbeirensis JCM 10989 TaxID=1227493 RepID=M0A594_9EURY|nr:hypothetical protein [Natrialba hulunbeirensis]ELY93925.1 hypothetical protein C483_04579 [Natrialba hulunbeirensis JCM 10989]